MNFQKSNLKFKAHGTSLLPFIRHGAIVQAEQAEYANLNTKDLILYFTHNGNIAAVFFGKKLDPKYIIGKIVSLKPSFSKYLPNLNLVFLLLYRTGCKFLSLLQKFKPYRFFARNTFSGDFIYKIADAEECEIANVLHCIGQSFLPLDKPAAENPNHYCFIAKRKNKIVGRLSLVYQDKGLFTGWGIYSAYVKPLYRGLGTGEKLEKEAFKILLDKNVKEVYLTVNKNNSRAINLYKKMNFYFTSTPESEEIFRKENNNRHQRVLMKRDL